MEKISWDKRHKKETENKVLWFEEKKNEDKRQNQEDDDFLLVDPDPFFYFGEEIKVSSISSRRSFT